MIRIISYGRLYAIIRLLNMEMWNPDDVFYLIGLFKKHPVLYKKNHPEYGLCGSRSLRKVCLDQIQDEMMEKRPGTTYCEIMHIWNELSGGYRRMKSSGSFELEDVTPELRRFIGFMTFCDYEDRSTQTSPMNDDGISLKFQGPWGEELDVINDFLECASDEGRAHFLKAVQVNMIINSGERLGPDVGVSTDDSSEGEIV